MAAKKKTGSIGSDSAGSSGNKNKKVGSGLMQAAPSRKTTTGRAPSTSMPSPAVAARRDFLTGGTGQGSGRTGYNMTSTWKSQYDLEMSRLKRNAMTSSGQGSGRPKNPGSEGPKRPKPRIPKTK